MTDSCRTCRYYEAWDGLRGDCRRNPPVILLRLATASQDDEFESKGMFPMVYQNRWCGEWSERQEVG